MKKILIAAAAITFAVVTQAASFAWDNGDGDLYVSSGSGDVADGYIVYLMDAGVTSVSAAQAAFATGDFSSLSTGWAADYASDQGWVEGAGVSGFTSGSAYNLYLVAFDAGAAADANNFYISDELTVNFPGSGLPGIASWDLSATETASNWAAISSESVPEPTSGLLLLLGMAGLALRRKQI